MCKYQHNSLFILSTLLRARSREKLQKKTKNKKQKKNCINDLLLINKPMNIPSKHSHRVTCYGNCKIRKAVKVFVKLYFGNTFQKKEKKVNKTF